MSNSALCISIQPVAGWPVTPLVSGRGQKVVALGLFCVFLVVESVSLNLLPAAIYDLIWNQPPCWSFQHVVEFLLLLSQSNPLARRVAFHPATGQTEHVLQIQQISLLPKCIKLITRSVFLCAFTYGNIGHLKVNVLYMGSLSYLYYTGSVWNKVFNRTHLLCTVNYIVWNNM